MIRWLALALTYCSLMIPGLQHDDRWRMVEDEFLATAHKFTAHLHAAEYHRLREMARKQEQDGSRFTLHQVPSSAPDNVKRSRIAKRLAISQQNGMKRAFARTKDADEEDPGETPWAGTHLHDLMERPRKRSMALTRMVSVVAGTRAAALSRSQEQYQREQTQSARSISANRPPKARQPNVSFAPDSVSLGRGQSYSRFTTRRESFTGQPSTTAEDSRLDETAKPSASSADRPTIQAPKVTSSTTLTTEDDDSESSVENEFQRLRKERHKQARVSRRKSATPDASGQGVSSNKRNSHNTLTKTLSVPSV